MSCLSLAPNQGILRCPLSSTFQSLTNTAYAPVQMCVLHAWIRAEGFPHKIQVVTMCNCISVLTSELFTRKLQVTQHVSAAIRLHVDTSMYIRKQREHDNPSDTSWEKLRWVPPYSFGGHVFSDEDVPTKPMQGWHTLKMLISHTQCSCQVCSKSAAAPDVSRPSHSACISHYDTDM